MDFANSSTVVVTRRSKCRCPYETASGFPGQAKPNEKMKSTLHLRAEGDLVAANTPHPRKPPSCITPVRGDWKNIGQPVKLILDV